MTANINALLDRLQGVKKTGQYKWMAKCPAHDDRSASFGIKLTDDGKILLNCFAGCDKGAVLDSIGLSFADLFPPVDNDPTKPKSRIPRFTAGEMLRMCIFEAALLGLAIDALMHGDKLSENDSARVAQALSTIDEIRKEVTR